VQIHVALTAGEIVIFELHFLPSEVRDSGLHVCFGRHLWGMYCLQRCVPNLSSGVFTHLTPRIFSLSAIMKSLTHWLYYMLLRLSVPGHCNLVSMQVQLLFQNFKCSGIPNTCLLYSMKYPALYPLSALLALLILIIHCKTGFMKFLN
jgi:hypothetical protein